MDDHLDARLATPLYTRSQLDLGKPGKGYCETLLYHADYGFYLHTRTVIVEGEEIATRSVKAVSHLIDL